MARRFDHLSDVEVFLCVIEQGSLTRAAVSLSTTPSVVSRAIGRLEAHLGSQLLRRTTRSLSLTDAGQLYLEQTRAAFTLIEDAERALQGQQGVQTGRVRLSVPTTYAHFRMPPLLRRFQAAYPLVQVEVNISNRNVDLAAEGFDLAVRLGQLPDSGLVGRKLEDAPVCFVASPDYVRRMGEPGSIDELARHQCISFLMPSTGRTAPWQCQQNGAGFEWVPPTALQVSDDVLGVASLAEQGLGICQAYEFVVADRIARGLLVEVLPGLRGRTRAFSVIYAPHRSLSAAARAMIETLCGTAPAPL